MRAGRVYDFTAQGDVCKEQAAAEAPVAWTGTSGTGQTESWGGARSGTGRSGMG